MVPANDETRVREVSSASPQADATGRATPWATEGAQPKAGECRLPSVSRIERPQEPNEEVLTNLMNDAKGG